MKKTFRHLMNFLARRRQAGAAGTPPKPPACPFPNCGVVVITPVPGQPPFCPAHLRLTADVLYIVNHLKPVDTPKKGPTIVVPRGPFPGPGKAA